MMIKSQLRAIRRQDPMLRFCIAVSVFIVFVGTAGQYFNKVFDSVEVTEAHSAVAGFASAVIQVHQDWLVQGKPNRVTIRSIDDAGKPANDWVFVMNAKGWPINVIEGGEKPDCRALWYALQKNERLVFSGQAVKMLVNEFGQLESTSELDRRINGKNQITWVCQNIVAQQLLFNYRLDTGKVEFNE